MMEKGRPEIESFEPLKEFDDYHVFIDKQTNILWIIFLKNCTIDKEVSMQFLKDIDPIIKEHKVKLVVSDNRQPFIDVDEEARKILRDNETLRLLTAQAILINDLPSRLLANFFLKINQPAIPFKLFNEVENAINWLIKMQADALEKSRLQKK